MWGKTMGFLIPCIAGGSLGPGFGFAPTAFGALGLTLGFGFALLVGDGPPLTKGFSATAAENIHAMLSWQGLEGRLQAPLIDMLWPHFETPKEDL